MRPAVTEPTTDWTIPVALGEVRNYCQSATEPFEDRPPEALAPNASVPTDESLQPPIAGRPLLPGPCQVNSGRRNFADRMREMDNDVGTASSPRISSSPSQELSTSRRSRNERSAQPRQEGPRR